jgi:hypothetical protein
LIDPKCNWLCGRLPFLFYEAFLVFVGARIASVIGRHQADASTVMFLIVPIEGAATPMMAMIFTIQRHMILAASVLFKRRPAGSARLKKHDGH